MARRNPFDRNFHFRQKKDGSDGGAGVSLALFDVLLGHGTSYGQQLLPLFNDPE
jgi:hypothetical protein